MDYSTFDLDNNDDLFKQLDQVTTAAVGNANDNINSTANMNFMNQSLPSATTSNSNTPTVDLLNFLDTTAVSSNDNATNNYNFRNSFNSVPQLSPDGTEGANLAPYTNSSVLSGQNPKYTMSPLQIATQQIGVALQQQATQQAEQQPLQHQFSTPLQHPMSNSLTQTPTPFDDFMDDDEFFTPLVSPAIAPSYDQQFQISNMPNTTATTPGAAAATATAISMNVFSPLSSPALNPTNAGMQQYNFLNQNATNNLLDQTTLQQKLAFIERQQQQLRNMHQQIRQSSVISNAPADASATSPTVSGGNGSNSKTSASASASNKRKSMHSSPRSFTAPNSSKQMASSPLALTPRNASNHRSTAIAPATPSLLMKLGSGGGNHAPAAVSNTMSPLSQPAITMAPSVTSPMSLPSSTPSSALSATIMSSSAAVDNMSSLPAAMLSEPPKSAPLLPSNPPKIPKQKLASTMKRRRISSGTTTTTTAVASPGLSPNPSHLVQFSPLGPRPATSGISSSSSSSTMHHSPRTLKPLISPSLQPNGKRLSTIEVETARALLTTKSNYENLKEGTAKHLGIDFSTTIQSGIENRRSAHKAAEQKRRDTLKQSFDALRVELIDAFMDDDMTDEEEEVGEEGEAKMAEQTEKEEKRQDEASDSGNKEKEQGQQQENTIDEAKPKDASGDKNNEGMVSEVKDGTDENNNAEEEQAKKKKLTPEEQRLEKEKEVKNMSKVVLLQHSYEYILRLKTDNKRMNEKIQRVVDELKTLRKQLGLPEETEEERLERERELQEVRARKEARRRQKQLQLEQQKAKEKEAKEAKEA